MKRLMLAGLVLLAGCASAPPPPAFSLSMSAARERARDEGKPLLVVSAVGDVDGRLCAAADALRTVTLADERVRRALDDAWVTTWHSPGAGIACDRAVDTQRRPADPAGASAEEGAGRAHLRLFFCDSQGRELSEVRGFLPPGRMLEELDCGLALAELAADARRQAEEGHVPVLKLDDPRIPVHRRSALVRLMAGRDIATVLRQVEDEVRMKGPGECGVK